MLSVYWPWWNSRINASIPGLRDALDIFLWTGGTLAGGIAHDFNNILSAVIGCTELALINVEKGTALYNYLHEVFMAGGRAKDLVHQILTFSRQAEQERKPVLKKDIATTIRKVLDDG